MEIGKLGTLSLDQLRVLVTIADTGSFSAAGRALGRAQSAMSQAIATLEELQGVTLFDRSGYRPALTEVGRTLVEQARLVLASAGRFEAVAADHRRGLEPELKLAIDPLVPTPPLVESLEALRSEFPSLTVRFVAESLGGSLRRLRDDSVALAICLLLPNVPEDVVAHPLRRLPLMPVVAASHPLASLGRPASRSDLEAHVQLVLSDPATPQGADYGVVSAHRWNFVDLSRRFDFLLGGLGWCRMPEEMVTQFVCSGALVVVDIEDDPAPSEPLMIYAAHRRDRSVGPTGRWLLDTLRRRLDTRTSDALAHVRG